MFGFFERGLYWFASQFAEGDVDSFVQLGTVVSDDTLVTKRGSLMTVIEIRGALKLIGDPEFTTMRQSLAVALGDRMKAGNGHSFALGFRSSPEGAPRVVHEAMRPAYATARRLKLGSLAALDDLRNVLTAVCREETAYLVMFSHWSLLGKAEIERGGQRHAEAMAAVTKQVRGVGSDDSISQRIRSAPANLVSKHAAAVKALMTRLTAELDKGGVGLLAEVMAAPEALALIRRHQDAGNFPYSWRPRTVVNAGGPAGMDLGRKNADSILPMALSRQMLPEPLTEHFGDVEYASRGGICYGGLALEVPPETMVEEFSRVRFQNLMESLGRSLPLSVNIEVIPNGASEVRKFDSLVASFAGAFGGQNEAIKKAWLELKKIARREPVVAIRAVFTTWAKSEADLVDRVNLLKASIESWGSSTATNERGHPALMTISAAAGLCTRMPAKYIPLSLADTVRLLPVFRPASVWDHGQLLLHTLDGRPYPVAFGTSRQNFWGTAIFAPSGSGKTFLINRLLYGLATDGGAEELPCVTMIDVGPGSKLSFDLLRSTLPPELAAKVVSIRVRNTSEFATNPFDTFLGCDRPTPNQRAFVVNVVSTVCGGLGEHSERFIGLVVDVVYRRAARGSQGAKRWQPGLDPELNEELVKLGFEVKRETLVWDVVDAFMAAGKPVLARRAHRFAMPLLQETVNAANSDEVRAAYGTALVNGESLIAAFCRGISTGVGEYSMLNGYTAMDLAGARMVSIDLEEMVSDEGSEESRRRAALMFQYARSLGARRYFMRQDELKDIAPDLYRDHLMSEAKSMEAALKFLIYDEAHYATGIPAMEEVINRDLRVGRKYKCVTVLSSQRLADFTPAMISNLYTIFALGAGSEEDLANIGKTFGLSQSEVDAISANLRGRGKLFGLFKTDKGTVSQILASTTGPLMRWAFNTDRDDALVREAVCVRAGVSGIQYMDNLRRLAAAFPGGSAREAMERYRQMRSDGGGRSVVEVMADRALAVELD